METINDDDVKLEIHKVAQHWEYPLGKPDDETIAQSIRLYMATVRLCEEKNFSAISYKSVEGISASLGILHSIPSSLVATAGYPYIDENDVGNLIAELMLKLLSGKPVTFLEHYEHHPEWILLGVDGFIPDQFIDGRPQIKRSSIVSEGIAHCSRMKTGRMTLACLSESGDGYRMHIVTGEGRTPPVWVEMGADLPPWPSVSFYPDADVRTILDHVQSQHFAAVFGSHVDELADLCYLLDIEPVVDSDGPAEPRLT
jgi:L-fucose isomerase-like protein